MAEFLRGGGERQARWIDEMDCQHDAILSMLESLLQLDADRASKAELSSSLEALRDYTACHFEAEEAYMAATGYAKLDVHQVIHRDLLIRLDEHRQRFERGGERLGAALYSFLKFWLAAHITGVDQQYPRHALRRTHPAEATEEMSRVNPA